MRRSWSIPLLCSPLLCGHRKPRRARGAVLRDSRALTPFLKGTPRPACAPCCRSCGGLLDGGFQRLLEHVHFRTCAHMCAQTRPSSIGPGVGYVSRRVVRRAVAGSVELAARPRVLVNCPPCAGSLAG